MARVLIAEDDMAVQSFVCRALAHRGHNVTGVDGIALALKVSRDYPKLPILLMTGYSAERQRAHNLDALVFKVIPKPFTLAQICDAVDAMLEAHNPPARLAR